ncbi:uncharacterized protein BCR38DRAFT_390839 [Pseudomassariella vexata]|uniref:CFEM domain-containing protein n=1 Tax=Pseudomassariella vexata TaxID=1141098 RepID=A0A1Y2E241_9PEZI|nr:uncharacterized protein BCR38DRAFT_390839 [Pseudomassariella vexata]ORY64935.1 hypothetical protein BCR38DRAFT_390839 [Pseudomassariella vexata]
MRLSMVLGAAALLVREAVADNCLTVAQNTVPRCAQNCLAQAEVFGCAASDFACLCEQEASLYAAMEGCVANGCPANSFQAVIDGVTSVCNCAEANSFRLELRSVGSSFSSGSATPTVSSYPSTTTVPKTTADTTPPISIATAGAAAKARVAVGLVGAVAGAVLMMI